MITAQDAGRAGALGCRPIGTWMVRALRVQQPPGTDVLTANFGTIDP